jgi:hypothetical protein
LMIWLKVDRRGFFRAVRAILRHERSAVKTSDDRQEKR